MIRIGFDPGLDAQQQHQSLIRENELLRLAQEGRVKQQTGYSRFLARIGQQIAVLGANIAARYGDNLEGQITISSQRDSNGCTS